MLSEKNHAASATQMERWNGGLGKFWIEHRERHLAVHQFLTSHLFCGAGITAGDRVLRRVLAAASGFNETGVGQLAEAVHERVDDFLLALGFDKRFVAARELISAEVARVLG